MRRARVKRGGRPRCGLVVRRSGAVATEFALVLPLLLMLMLGIFEFGRVWNAKQVLTSAAWHAARLAAVGEVTDDSVTNVVRNALARAALNPDSARILLSGTDGKAGTETWVTVEYPYRLGFLAPLMGWAADSSTVTLSAVTVMRHE